jgi:autoinducer 2-degrading protein
MEFKPDHVDDFRAHFKEVAHLIRGFPGVRHLELHRDAGQANVFYTYSKWNREEDLENYRQSDLFKGTWSQASSWFSERAQAFSLRQELVLD